MAERDRILVRGCVLHFLDDPGAEDRAGAWQWFDDGGLLIGDGRIRACGPWAEVNAQASGTAVQRFNYPGHLILPGLVDTHMHYAQAEMIASFGHQLLDWLGNYTYPTEMRFADAEHATRMAGFVLDRLLAHGTTTASVFATSHAVSADAFFAAAHERNLRMLTGKVMMDRECPAELRDTVETAERDSVALIERWHGKGRLGYTVTPRFAITSTDAQLAMAGRLFKSRPDLHLQSHLAENVAECARVAELFPGSSRYLEVYERFDLTGPRSIYGHCIHLNGDEHARMAQSGTAQAFCPTSNLFLGSGAYDLASASRAGVRVGLATDVGGGTSLSMIRTLSEAYKVQQMHHAPLSAWRGWYLATLGGARALHLEDCIGNFLPGKEADFVVLDWNATPEMRCRMDTARTIDERLF
ncbi:MAG: guanine deaminase, partial [Betaproteobacteria bacterium]|nr:guanine deaminase [Betaproteobacteria bacterium]